MSTLEVYKVCRVHEDGEYWSAVLTPEQGGRQYRVGVTMSSKIAPFMAFKAKRDAMDFIHAQPVIRPVILKCVVRGIMEPSRIMYVDEVKKGRIPLFWKAVRGLSRVSRYVLLGKNKSVGTGFPPMGTVFCMDIKPVEVIELKLTWPHEELGQ